MNGALANLASRYAGRPLLLTPQAAQDLAVRLLAVDPRALERPSRIGAILRKLTGANAVRGPVLAGEDDDDTPPVPFHVRAAYTPLYIGEAEDVGFCWSLKDGVALMQADTALMERGEIVCGTVYHGYDTLLAGLRDAAADDRVRGTFLRMSCPGGVVAGGLEALAAFMRENREAAGGKPIWVYADMACSAAYWISAQADRILAPKVGLVGSIGAVLVHMDYSGALEQAGVAVTSIEFPEGGLKTDGAWWKALSDTAKADLQAEIDQCGRNFIADVVAGRSGFTPEALLATKAGVFMAQHEDEARSGQALGFVDAIASEEEAFAELVEHVSRPTDTVSAPRTGTQPAPAATGSRDGRTTSKEEPMARTATTPAGRKAAQVAQAEKALRTAQANLAKAQATADAEGEDDEETPETGAGGDEPAKPAKKKDEEEEDEDDTSAEASAIAASAEAKAHPQLALAAIQSGQTLAQFKASAAAVGQAPKVSKLDRAMSGATRLGPDAARAEGGRAAFGSALTARAEARRGDRA